MFRSPPRSGEGARETETQEPQEPEEDEILEDAVEEPWRFLEVFGELQQFMTTYDNSLTTLSSELKTCVTWLTMAIVYNYMTIYALHWEALIRSFMNMLVRTPARWKRALQEQVLHKPCATCMLNLAAKQGKRMTFAPHSFPFAMTMYEDPCTTKHLQSFAMFVVFLIVMIW